VIGDATLPERMRALSTHSREKDEVCHFAPYEICTWSVRLGRGGGEALVRDTEDSCTSRSDAYIMLRDNYIRKSNI
jgi:hypothetical protein